VSVVDDLVFKWRIISEAGLARVLNRYEQIYIEAMWEPCSVQPYAFTNACRLGGIQ
jgi:hypothetical protein